MSLTLHLVGDLQHLVLHLDRLAGELEAALRVDHLGHRVADVDVRGLDRALRAGVRARGVRRRRRWRAVVRVEVVAERLRAPRASGRSTSWMRPSARLFAVTVPSAPIETVGLVRPGRDGDRAAGRARRRWVREAAAARRRRSEPSRVSASVPSARRTRRKPSPSIATSSGLAGLAAGRPGRAAADVAWRAAPAPLRTLPEAVV